MKPLFPIPTSLVPPASDAHKVFNARKFDECVAWCEKELAALEKQIPARNTKAPQNAEPGSEMYQFYVLTLILVNALAELREWKAAKETLGKYRVRFPQDPWGFRAGAEVTRRDTKVQDKAAVQRAIELLEGEAKRLREKQG